MSVSRRTLLGGFAAGFLTALSTNSQTLFASDVAPHPDPLIFQSGDLLWPAKANDVIPYKSDYENSESKWIEGRDALARTLSDSLDPALQEAARQLKRMTYEEFCLLFFENIRPADPLPYGSWRLRVGHVAIVDVDEDGKIWVIEAIPDVNDTTIIWARTPNGVRRTPYSIWVDKHLDFKIWLGRLRNYSEHDRALVSNCAKSFVGRDYWIWGLNLKDDEVFYCSKLVWVSIHNSLSFNIDGDPFLRPLWISPKYLMNLPNITMIHNPGFYGTIR